jgi:hypothetical protein
MKVIFTILIMFSIVGCYSGQHTVKFVNVRISDSSELLQKVKYNLEPKKKCSFGTLFNYKFDSVLVFNPYAPIAKYNSNTVRNFSDICDTLKKNNFNDGVTTLLFINKGEITACITVANRPINFSGLVSSKRIIPVINKNNSKIKIYEVPGSGGEYRASF